MWGNLSKRLPGVRGHSVSGHSDAILAGTILSIILILILPLPSFCLDILLCLSILFSVITLLLTIYVEDTLEFSALPTFLLFMTLFRLGINMATTRRILSHGEGGDIIQTFGSFVTEGNMLVGVILFTLLTIINFVVVTKGSGRVAEVAARFNLEALPGKQAHIESELASGVIGGQEAKVARTHISKEAEFYGAMDGASKFVRGDAIAGILITSVNMIGGLIIGLFLKKMELKECVNTYLMLTIGDGLVSQIPALLVSVGAGIAVTRASKGSLSKSLTKQIFNHPQVLMAAGIILLLLGCIPGMPFFVMMPIAATLCAYAYTLFNVHKPAQKVPSRACIEIILGAHHASHGKEVLAMTKQVRQMQTLPSVHVKDSLTISPHKFEVWYRQQRLCSGRGDLIHTIHESLLAHSYLFITRNDVQKMIEEVKEVDPTLVAELIPHKIELVQLMKIIKQLAKEGVALQDFSLILEIIAAEVGEKKVESLDPLLQTIREGLAHEISRQVFDGKRVAHAITLDQKVEKMLSAVSSVEHKAMLRPKTIDQIARNILDLMQKAECRGHKPVVLTHSESRAILKRLIETKVPHLPVLSYKELVPEMEVVSIGKISSEVLI